METESSNSKEAMVRCGYCLHVTIHDGPSISENQSHQLVCEQVSGKMTQTRIAYLSEEINERLS